MAIISLKMGNVTLKIVLELVFSDGSHSDSDHAVSQKIAKPFKYARIQSNFQ